MLCFPNPRLSEKRRAVTFVGLFICFLVLSASVSFGQTDKLRVEYTVKIKSIDGQLFHVTTRITNIAEPKLDISLPTWAPGWYTIENYAKNILRFEVTDSKGQRLPHILIRKQTWRVNTKGLDAINIDFDYKAGVLALNQAKIDKDFAFFTGIELFVMAEGHRNTPSKVHFEVPQNWKIISALTETSDPTTFTAPDYDTLVDAPTEVGNFDMTPFQVEGKPHYFVSTPAGAFSKDKAQKFSELLTKVANTDSKIFGGLPYQKYVYYYFFARPESNASGALEHLNSHVAFAGNGNSATPERLIDTAAHEYFHLWNVKRIRPIEMWPYDYSRENETPSLWVSEGFTNYYGELAQYRAGIIDRNRFLQGAAGAITQIEGLEPRKYISPAESSASTWLGYDTGVEFEISYYTQGQNLGALLDLSIFHDTNGSAGLDEVMRTLYKEFYQKGKGFSTEDMIGVVNRITKKDYHDFYNRYVWGVEVPDYDKLFGYAGYKATSASRKVPELGFGMSFGQEGIKVTALKDGGPAAKAGIQVGDIIKTIDGTQQWRGRLNEKIGQTVKVSFKRGEEEKTVDLAVGSRDNVSYQIVEVHNPTPEQSKVREAWLRRDSK